MTPQEWTDDWEGRVIANGGTVSAGTLAAVLAFVTSAQADAYWDKFHRINLFAGNELAAALVPLKPGGGNATDTNVNYVGGDYAENTGLTGAAGKYLRTGVIPSTMLTADDTHLSFYLRGTTPLTRDVMGASDSTAQALVLRRQLSGANIGITSRQYNGTIGSGAVGNAVVNAPPWGLITGSRVSATDHKTYVQATAKETSATSGGTLPTIEIYFNAQNSAGTAGTSDTSPMGMYSIGAGLTGADMTAFAAANTTFQTALGRNV